MTDLFFSKKEDLAADWDDVGSEKSRVVDRFTMGSDPGEPRAPLISCRFRKRSYTIVIKVTHAIRSGHPTDCPLPLLTGLCVGFRPGIPLRKSPTHPLRTSSGTTVATYCISAPLSQRIDEHLNFKTASPIKAYEKFISGCTDGFYPVTATFGRLINALGHAGEIEKVNLVYENAQHAIAMATTAPAEDPNDPWYQIEDHMIIALAHAGGVEGAHNHRHRILEYGGTPSADAYGTRRARTPTTKSKLAVVVTPFIITCS